MIVNKCVEKKPTSLSFSDIQKEEGVYTVDGYPDRRFIVINSIKGKTTVLHFTKKNNELVGIEAATSGWDSVSYSFRKVDETVHLEVK